MADTTTTNLVMTKPEVGLSNDTWGTKLNADLDILDALFGSGPVSKNAGFTTTATAAATTTLTAASTLLQYFTGTTTQTIALPVTSTLTLGWHYIIVSLRDTEPMLRCWLLDGGTIVEEPVEAFEPA